jgi:hypothetical protein
MRIEGACHCGNLRLVLAWPDHARPIPARACGCTFCTKHGAAWTSHPAASLRVTVESPAHWQRYAFGTGTADFHLCTRCGVPVVATSAIEGRDYAVVNVNTFERFDAALLDRSRGDFEGESVEDRLGRRRKRWIGDVFVDTGEKT